MAADRQPGPQRTGRGRGVTPRPQEARSAAYPHGDTVCAGCHACQPERFPNTSAAYCGCRVCNPTGVPAPSFARDRHADEIRRALRALGDTRIATLIDRGTAEKGYDALDALLAEIERLREALEAFANPQHWAVTRDGREPVPIWIGTYRKPPVELAREALGV